MYKRLLASLLMIGFFSVELFAQKISPAPSPTVFLSGNGQEMSLAQQINKSMPAEDAAQAPPQNFTTSDIGNQMTGFETEIVTYNQAINKAFKKFSETIATATPGDKAIAYVLFKQAQQTNLLLQQQNKLLKTVIELNDNLEILISQNNQMLINKSGSSSPDKLNKQEKTVSPTTKAMPIMVK